MDQALIGLSGIVAKSRRALGRLQTMPEYGGFWSLFGVIADRGLGA
jgi:hypothetical protein